MASSTSLNTSVVVGTPIDAAFKTFTEQMAEWWPPEHHILEGQLAEMIFEPTVGGRIYDRSVDGAECCWARVLAYEPPTRVVFSWDIGPSWALEEDHAKTSEVEVRFIAEGPEVTRVELEHRHLDRHGPGWEQLRGALGEGWGSNLQRFARLAET